MRKFLGFVLLACMAQTVGAQRVLSLDSCRAMALRNNKQLSVTRVKQDVAKNLRKSARTKYLPHVSALGTYQYSSREISILNDDQKTTLSTLGTSMATSVTEKVGPYAQILPAALQAKLGGDLQQAAGRLNMVGQHVVDLFRTDTRNILGAAVIVTQPVFMGGAIIALNKMAGLGEQLAANTAEQKRQATLYEIDQTYWQVVSLRHKQRLAESYLELVRKLEGDVQKMIDEGVATRSEGLSVSVKVNEAEMTLMKVNDGLSLLRMLLCQQCGLPLNEPVTLADEASEELPAAAAVTAASPQTAMENRPELKMLQNVVDMSHQTVNIMKAGHLPQVLLTGGYVTSNPNTFNGFEKKFGGFWNVGVLMRVPIWNWGDVTYKVRAAKGAAAIATLELEEAREKIELQVSQSMLQANEADKKLEMARVSTQRADENLRTANLGFREGVISTTTVMEAQTAWLQAQSQKIDAEIDVRLSRSNLQKALGVLSE